MTHVALTLEIKQNPLGDFDFCIRFERGKESSLVVAGETLAFQKVDELTQRYTALFDKTQRSDDIEKSLQSIGSELFECWLFPRVWDKVKAVGNARRLVLIVSKVPIILGLAW